MIKKTIAGKAFEIFDFIRNEGFDEREMVGILFIALREITVDTDEAIDHVKDCFCRFMDNTKQLKRDEISDDFHE